MIKSPSQELFDRIVKDGLNYVNDAIKQKYVENYYLDFKSTQLQDYTDQRSLLENDRKNYARALSAFGNSEGGVLLWGIKTGKRSSDFAETKAPIEKVSNFLSLLEGFTSTLTSPPHPIVLHKSILEEVATDSGYVVSHIAKSNRRPFQVLDSNDFRYYIRAGSSSVPAPDSFLRALFGQEPQSNTYHMFVCNKEPTHTNEKIEIKVGLLLHNGGECVSKNLNGYVQVQGDTSILPVAQGAFDYNMNKLHGLKMGFTAKPQFILGVEQEVLVLTIGIDIGKPPHDSGIRIVLLINADNQQSYRLEKVVSAEELGVMFERFQLDNTYKIADHILKEGPK